MHTVLKLFPHWAKTEVGVLHPDGQELVLVKVKPNDTMKQIRLHLVKQGITSWKMDFTYKGRKLGENETLEGNRITSGAVLLLVKDSHPKPSRT
ncbi:ubiquitin domain-containing protein TINCR-like [Leucoraja erinacea]|uniref:ubiquitin domain-containing protein TINCR-like n=1 Tax=Leucoraja erinaceus TaxID=7782 RepID=UPI002455A09A|nr:ubiquitin domain-containing protein TINCR-like [Leucoraja erinacea]